METLRLLFNGITVIFIAATMFAAGLGTTLPALRAIVTTPLLLVLALLANLVVVPLLGWGIATLFGLPPLRSSRSCWPLHRQAGRSGRNWE